MLTKRPATQAINPEDNIKRQKTSLTPYGGGSSTVGLSR
jgi:hypothetical protein